MAPGTAIYSHAIGVVDSVMDCYPANLCRLGRYVVNEVRRLADDPLSHYERPNARRAPERCHCLLKHAVGTPGMTNFEQKKNDGISISSDVHRTSTLASIFSTLAGILADIGS